MAQKIPIGRVVPTWEEVIPEQGIPKKDLTQEVQDLLGKGQVEIDGITIAGDGGHDTPLAIKVSEEEGNALDVLPDGLYVPTTDIAGIEQPLQNLKEEFDGRLEQIGTEIKELGKGLTGIADTKPERSELQSVVTGVEWEATAVTVTATYDIYNAENKTTERQEHELPVATSEQAGVMTPETFVALEQMQTDIQEIQEQELGIPDPLDVDNLIVNETSSVPTAPRGDDSMTIANTAFVRDIVGDPEELTEGNNVIESLEALRAEIEEMETSGVGGTGNNDWVNVSIEGLLESPPLRELKTAIAMRELKTAVGFLAMGQLKTAIGLTELKTAIGFVPLMTLKSAMAMQLKTAMGIPLKSASGMSLKTALGKAFVLKSAYGATQFMDSSLWTDKRLYQAGQQVLRWKLTGNVLDLFTD